MVKKRRWSNKDIIPWAEEYLKPGENINTLEKRLKVPHATICWCFHNRLPYINLRMYRKVVKKLDLNKYPSIRNKLKGVI